MGSLGSAFVKLENVSEMILSRVMTKPLKRPLEDDDEGDDSILEFGEDARAPIRRGRKEGRRVSGVYKELKSLHMIGHNASVMGLVFDRMSIKDVMACGGQTCRMWYAVACRAFRKRHGNSSFIRLWINDVTGGKCNNYLWMSWAIHAHDELLAGSDPRDEPVEEGNVARKKEPVIPAIQALFSIGNRNAFSQFTNENAQLPYKQEHIYAISQKAIVTAPDFSFTDTFESMFSLDMAVQTLFIPKSSHFTVKGFGLEYNKDVFTPEEVFRKVYLPKEDTGVDQELRAVFLLKHRETEATLSFFNGLKQMGPIYLLDGCPEEVGCNQIAPANPNELMPGTLGAGFSFYCGRGANVTVYGIDCMQPNAEGVLQMMKVQVESARNGFCLVVYHDGRPYTSGEEETDPDSSMDWEFSEKPADADPLTAQVLEAVRTIMPKTPLLGINSICPVNIFCSNETSNMNLDSPSSVCFAFLLLTYQD